MKFLAPTDAVLGSAHEMSVKFIVRESRLPGIPRVKPFLWTLPVFLNLNFLTHCISETDPGQIYFTETLLLDSRVRRTLADAISVSKRVSDRL